MEKSAEAFYLLAATRTTDASTRKLLGDLAAAEASHMDKIFGGPCGIAGGRHLDGLHRSRL